MAVSLEQARLAHKLGIAQRKSDGKFGFKLPCPVCHKPVKDSCFCAETIEDAIEAVQDRQAPWACSKPCALKWSAHWDSIRGELQEFWSSRDETSQRFIELQDRLVEALHLKGNEYAWTGWPKVWTCRLRLKHPALYREVIEFFAESQDPSDYEPWEDDEGEIEACSCEIDA